MNVQAGSRVGDSTETFSSDRAVRTDGWVGGYSRVQSNIRGTRRMDASALGCEARALQRSLLDEMLSIVTRGLRPRIRRTDRSAERTRCPHDLGRAANAF
jgi:hypothetical protein